MVVPNIKNRQGLYDVFVAFLSWLNMSGGWQRSAISFLASNILEGIIWAANMLFSVILYSIIVLLWLSYS